MRYRRIAGLTVLAMMLSWSFSFAGPRVNRAVLGSVAATGGKVLVDQVDALPGTTVMEGDVIATGMKSDAVVDLRSGTKLTVAEKSEVALLYDEMTARFQLREGSVTVQTGSGKTSQVSTKYSTSVVVHGADGLPASCKIALAGLNVGIMNQRGRVEVHGGGVPFVLPVGKFIVLRANPPQGGVRPVGKVTAAIPSEVVDRNGSIDLPLDLNDAVYWQDLVRTQKAGRVRIELAGGSVLNIGARSQMRIVRHEAGSQQTELELKLGRMRGQIMKLTQPGANFEIKTQTAVIGVVGTDLLIIATEKSTRVICLEGVVRVTSSVPTVAGAAILHANEVTTVLADQPPAAASSISSNALRAEVSHTNIQGVANAGTQVAAQGAASATSSAVGGAATSTETALFGARLGLTAASIAASGVAIARAGDASDLADEASASAQGVSSGLSDVTSGVDSVGCALNTYADDSKSSISPYVPSSGSCTQ